MMNINRHNYEEYFILYMDNELSEAERHMVEDFAEKNPDLKEELEILLQSRLVPNQNIVFTGKNELFRSSENSVLTPANYEELLLLYIDNELTPELRSEVEKFIETSQQVKAELEILQKTKLQSETISFPDKESLYRKTEKVRIVQLRWWRIAAAAVVLLAISLTAIVLMNNKPGDTIPEKNIVTVDENTPAKYPVIETKGNDAKEKEPVSIAKEKQDVESNAKQIAKIDSKTIPDNQKAKKEFSNPEKNMDKNLIAENNQPQSNNLPGPVYERTGNMDAITNVIETEKTLSIQNNPHITVTKNVDKPYINTVARIDSDESDEGKNKLRGFFRKATRFVERTTNISTTDDDERLLIGGFAVKLK